MKAESVRIKVIGEQELLCPWLGLSAPLEDPLGDERRQAILDAAGQWVARAETFQVSDADDVAATEIETPELLALEYGKPALVISFDYSVQEKPRWVKLRAPVFPSADSGEDSAIPGQVLWLGDIQEFFLTPAEPEYTWHSRVIRPPSRAITPAPSFSPKHRSIPLVSLGLLVVVLGWALFFRDRPLPLSSAWRVWLILLVLAALARPMARVSVPVFWTTAASIPGESDAREIFVALHRSIYQAFEATSEEEIYDLLARSVSGELLDELYVDIYESLLLRGEGGAICRVDQVELLETEIDREAPSLLIGEPADEVARYQVECAWRVHGRVSHWGHTHRRVNQYRAIYQVHHDGASWKMEAVKMLETERLAGGTPED